MKAKKKAPAKAKSKTARATTQDSTPTQQTISTQHVDESAHAKKRRVNEENNAKEVES